MITNDQQLQTTRERIAWFQDQVADLRRTEANPVNYRAAASGFLAEIDRMQLEVREYLSMHPTELVGAADRNAGGRRKRSRADPLDSGPCGSPPSGASAGWSKQC